MTDCQICGARIERQVGTPPPRNHQHTKWNFDALEVGDALVIPLPQRAAASRLGSYRRSKTYADRRERQFTTRSVDANTTRIYRIR